jgi:diketogulonate reductase-like aldo/keto reductase
VIDTTLENYMTGKKDMPQMIYGTKGKRKKTIDLVIEAILVGFKGIDTSN